MDGYVATLEPIAPARRGIHFEALHTGVALLLVARFELLA
jgi:hypothetical protein